MKKFFLKFIILLTIISVFYGLISLCDYYVVGSQYKYNYQASLIDKVARLRRINDPKIILVGNSNVAFGIDSELIEEELGMPVVNLGLHGGLGNAFLEEIAKLNINKGDIVIVCHSSFYDNDTIPDPLLAWITIDKNPELRQIIRLKDWPSMLSSHPFYLKNDYFLWITHTGNMDGGGCFSRTAFNSYGDVVIRPEENQLNPIEFFKDTEGHGVPVPEIGKTCVNRLNKYNAYISSKGATLLIAGYPIAYGQFAPFSDRDFIEFKNQLQEELDCQIISDYTDYFFPYEYFYDTIYHLNRNGAEARSQQLIYDVKNWMETSE